jgi:hypothetical protein
VARGVITVAFEVERGAVVEELRRDIVRVVKEKDGATYVESAVAVDKTLGVEDVDE